jgi:hypothetical protein
MNQRRNPAEEGLRTAAARALARQAKHKRLTPLFKPGPPSRGTAAPDGVEQMPTSGEA